MCINNSKPLILVVDDDPGIYENIRILLKFNNFEVEVAENGLIALKKLSKLIESSIIPSLILSDILMPEMNGYEFFKVISQNTNWNKIPFIFLSALTYPEDIRLAKSLGVDDYITKPFNEKELIRVIKRKLSKISRIKTGNKNNEHFNTNLLFENTKLLFFNAFLTYDNKIDSCISFPHSPKFKNLANFILNSIINSSDKKITSIMDELNQKFIYIDFDEMNLQGSFLIDYKVGDNNQQYILGVLSNNMSYFISLFIKKILKEISILIYLNETWIEKEYYQKLRNSFEIENNEKNDFNFNNFINSQSYIK